MFGKNSGARMVAAISSGSTPMMLKYSALLILAKSRRTSGQKARKITLSSTSQAWRGI
ncbi:hypothetical protein D3C72_2001640 [compost metagenome]